MPVAGLPTALEIRDGTIIMTDGTELHDSNDLTLPDLDPLEVASVTVTGNIDSGGNLSVDGDADIGGDAAITGDLAVTGKIDADGGITPVSIGLDIKAGENLAEGDLVYISGWDEGDLMRVASKADADAVGRHAQYIAREAILGGVTGRVFRTYRLTNVNTSAGSVGDPVYLSTTAGGWTLTAPSGSDDTDQIVGRIAVDNAAGEIEFDLLSENGGVAIGSNELQPASVLESKIAPNTLTGLVAANVADANVIGGVPVVHRILVASGANGDVDVTLTHKTRVIDAWAVLKGAGTAGSLITIKNAGNAISDALDVSAGGDRDIFRIGEIDDARHEIAAAGTLRVSKASTGANFPGAEVYVTGLRIA